MKTILLILILAISCSVSAQIPDSLQFIDYNLSNITLTAEGSYYHNLIDSVSSDWIIDGKDFCEERGHIWGDGQSSTLMYCPPYILDQDTVSYKVYPPCNYFTKTCMRCGTDTAFQEEEVKILIWSKSREKIK